MVANLTEIVTEVKQFLTELGLVEESSRGEVSPSSHPGRAVKLP